MPAPCAIAGSRSTGSRSMKLNRNTQQKIVSASGAISRLVPWKVSFTCESTNSTTSSTKFWNLPGTPTPSRLARREPEAAAEHHREQHGEEHAVEVQRPEAASPPDRWRDSSGGGRCIRWRWQVLRRPCSCYELLNALRERDPVHQERRDVSREQRPRTATFNGLEHHHEQHDREAELRGLSPSRSRARCACASVRADASRAIRPSRGLPACRFRRRAAPIAPRWPHRKDPGTARPPQMWRLPATSTSRQQRVANRPRAHGFPLRCAPKPPGNKNATFSPNCAATSGVRLRRGRTPVAKAANYSGILQCFKKSAGYSRPWTGTLLRRLRRVQLPDA